MIITQYLGAIIGVYIVLTIIFFFSAYNIDIWRSIFFVLFVCFIGFSLYGLAQFACKKINNVYEVCMAVIFPVLLILLLMMTCLYLLPAWVRVFSNTFGYIFDKDRPQIIQGILGTIGTGIQLEAIKRLYAEPSPFIDELDISDYVKDHAGNYVSWQSFTNIINIVRPNTQPTNNQIQALHAMLKQREQIGNCVWYILIGTITIFVSTNTLFSNGCGG